jgi:hypothetical protein
MHNTDEIWRKIDAHQDEFIALSDRGSPPRGAHRPPATRGSRVWGWCVW